jgi:hypothetical protein
MQSIMKISDYQYKLSIINSETDEYRLYQNFPQTFYKVTRIAFDIPETTSVKLMIYDVFGREVATLLNDEISTGSYEIKWNALNFTPGIYYYKLYAGSFIDSKKMVLLNNSVH